MLDTRAVLVATALLVAAPAARADSLASLPEPDYVKDAHNPQTRPLPGAVSHLVYPTVGLCSIVAPGEELTPVVHLADAGATVDWQARLVSARDVFVQTIRLPFRRLSFDPATDTYRLAFEVPPDVPEGAYDLAIESASLPGPSYADEEPNAVRVLRPRSEFVFAHVADTQIRDPGTHYPQKFEQLLVELRLRDPAFTLYSGDLNFGADYEKEYEESRAILDRGGVAVLAAPGNHDGYSWLTDATTVLYDGLHEWRRTIGPTYFSARYGGLRLIAANSYGGPSERRNGYTFLVHNSGGDIEPPQLAWIEAQGLEATAAGEEGVVFLHHNPRPDKSLTPSVPGYPWNVRMVGSATGVWNGQGSRDELTRILGDHTGLRWVLAGHTNNDEHEVRPLGAGAAAHDVHYVNTTSPCNGGWPKEGYRLITVRNGRIAEVDYLPAQPSVPFPFGGNLAVTWLDPNDGARGVVRARVANALEKPVDVTLEVFVPPDGRGYRASGGTIREVGLADAGVYVVYLRLAVPALGQAEVEVAPDGQARGARPAIHGGIPPALAPSGGGGGGGCRAGSGDGTPLATWIFVIVALAGLHFAARKK